MKCFSKPKDEVSGKPKKLKKSPYAELILQSLRKMNGMKVRTTMFSAVKSIFSVQHLLISLPFIYQILAQFSLLRDSSRVLPFQMHIWKTW